MRSTLLSIQSSGLTLAETVSIGSASRPISKLPDGYLLREELGLVMHEAISGQLVHQARPFLGETRAAITPGGDLLLMFPVGEHYGTGRPGKINDMLAYRSSDGGRTWQGPRIAFDIDYSQHGFIPLIPAGSRRIYAFGTQPVPSLYIQSQALRENAPIGYRYSDDDGYTWSDVHIIEPTNDPSFRGMSVMRMAETDRGTWLLGAHEADWSLKPVQTRQYLLRSEDQGRTWLLAPGTRPNGWYCDGYGRMDEGRPIALGEGRVLLMARTPEGHLWLARSDDDGRTFSPFAPTPLVHPDAPPMLFHLSDQKTLIALHHNRHSDRTHRGLDGNVLQMSDRAEIWFSLSRDEGMTWSEPRFMMSNAAAPNLRDNWRNYQCSYLDVVAENGRLHLFMPHRWERALHMVVDEASLASMATRKELMG